MLTVVTEFFFYYSYLENNNTKSSRAAATVSEESRNRKASLNLPSGLQQGALSQGQWREMNDESIHMFYWSIFRFYFLSSYDAQPLVVACAAANRGGRGGLKRLPRHCWAALWPSQSGLHHPTQMTHAVQDTHATSPPLLSLASVDMSLIGVNCGWLWLRRQKQIFSILVHTWSSDTWTQQGAATPGSFIQACFKAS